MSIPLIAIGASIVALLYAVALIIVVMRYDKGTEKMQEIAGFIQEGAGAFLARQNLTVGLFTLILFFVLAFALPENGFFLAGGFIAGALFSALAGYIGMSVSVRANVRTASAAQKNLPHALKVAFQGEQRPVCIRCQQ